MNAPPQKPKKSLLRKLLKIGLICLLLLLLVVVGAVAYGVYWLGSDKVKTIDNIALFGGGSLSVGAISVSDVWDYPELELTVRNLHVWEEARSHVDSAFIVMDEGRVRLRADVFNSDTILVRQLTYTGGRIHLVKDAQDQDAVGRMRQRRPIAKEHSPSRFKIIGAPDMVVGFTKLDVRREDPFRGKAFAGFIRSLAVSDLTFGNEKKATVAFDVELNGLTFKASEGPFGKNTRVQGELDFELKGGQLSARIPDLLADSTAIDFAMTAYPGLDSIATFVFDIPRVDLLKVRPMLAPGLQAKVEEFDADGVFAAHVELKTSGVPGNQSEVVVDLKLRGNKAEANGFVFDNTFLNGQFHNRLPGYAGNFNPEALGSTFYIDTIASRGFGFSFTTADVNVISPKGQGSFIKADIAAQGPAKSLSTLLKSDQYLFMQGNVIIDASIEGPLNDVTKILDQTDGHLLFENPSIRLVDAGVQLPLKQLVVDKKGNSASVNLVGFMSTDRVHPFQLEGRVQGVSKLIGGADPEEIKSEVKITSPHISWADLSAYLGSKEVAETAELADESAARPFDPASLKAVLSSVQSSFQPELELEIDTLSYRDVSLLTFQSGMHFNGADTLVLERTTFFLDTAKVGFGGSIYIGEKDQTAYQFSLKAKHVDIEQLLPKINYIGSKLLAELKTLPNDVDIEIDQLGFIHDRDGILPNSSTGFIDLVSNKQKAFRARVDFEPDRPEDPAFNSTLVNLEGNAALFNDFFDTEDFLFQDGDFEFSMAYAGLIPDLRTLVQNEEMVLDLREGLVLFKSAELEIPINRLSLDMLRDTAEVRLFLRSEALGQELRVDGIANNLSEVVLGKTGKQFSTTTSVVSERIVWKDLNALIGSFSGEKSRDTTEDLNLRKTTRAIMTKFRPDVQLRIKELQLNNRLALQDVQSGLRMDDLQRLHIDTTGFSYGDGSMQLAGSIALEDLRSTPFDLYLNANELNLASLMEGFDHFGITSLKETNILEGKMNLDLDLQGDILGEPAQFVAETGKGKMSFSFYDLEIDGFSYLDDIAKKFKMVDRLDDLKIAPLTNIVTFDSNTIHLPMMEIPSSAFRLFLAGDLEIGGAANFWVSVPLSNLTTPDSATALKPIGYADNKFKVHVEFTNDEEEGEIKPKLRWSRRKYYKQRQALEEWKANKKRWRAERKQARKD